MKTLGIIPARYASTRFPGKPLVEIAGRTMLQRVYDQACKAQLLSEVVIATDDQRIYDHALSFGARVFFTSDQHLSGTDRCAEVAAQFPKYDIIVNIQGDEPFIAPAQIDAVVEPFLQSNAIDIATLAKKIDTGEALFNPNVVKVVRDLEGKALYFSRSPIPYLRKYPESEWADQGLHYKHIGLYSYRRTTLLELTLIPPGIYEQAESLEQLRWLEAGFRIYVGLTTLETIGIDTPEDLHKLTVLPS